MVQGIDEFVEGIMPYYRERLADLVMIQSISQLSDPKDEAVDQYRAQELRRVVDSVASIAQSQGFTTNVITEGVPSPVLVTRMEVDPAAPWVMVYNHLDVQPASEPEWRTSAFEPVVTEEYIIARGATDDKGPMLAGLLPFKHLRDTSQLKVNVVGVYETQEENGSGGFRNALRFGLDNGLIPVPDSVLVSDTVFEGDHPTLSYALRGLVFATARLQTAETLVHSGMGGGVVANPLNILMSALNTCYDGETGEVTIPGLEEGVPVLEGLPLEKLREVAAVLDKEKYLADYKARETYHTADALDFLTRLWHKSTFELHQVRGGVQGTKIPYYAEVDVSLRLVGQQDPTRVLQYLTSHLQKFHPGITVEGKKAVSAVRTEIDGPFVERAIAACEYGFGRPPVSVACGGTIGAFPPMQEFFPRAPIIMIAMSKASDGYHAPNERFEWAQARMGMKAIAQYVASIGDLRTK